MMPHTDQWQTFLTSIEPYLRSFGEDDLAYLALKVRGIILADIEAECAQADDLSPFLIPSLGRHYTDAWADEDAGYGLASSVNGRNTSHGHPSPLDPPPLQRFRPDDLVDEHLVTENVHLGPLTERLMAALNEGGMADLVGDVAVDETDAAAGTAAPMDAVDLEDRLKRELRFLGVFPTDALVPSSVALATTAAATTGDVDWSLRADDEISTALRACQRALRDQIDTNEGRKAALAAIVRDRMAYQEYESTRDGIEKVIETGWIKRQRYGKRKVVPPVKVVAGRVLAPPVPVPAPGPTIVEPKPPLSQELVTQLDRRRRFIGAFARLFDGQPAGKFEGLPDESVYGDDVVTRTDAMLE
jgi:hypothetical protein